MALMPNPDLDFCRGVPLKGASSVYNHDEQPTSLAKTAIASPRAQQRTPTSKQQKTGPARGPVSKDVCLACRVLAARSHLDDLDIVGGRRGTDGLLVLQTLQASRVDVQRA